MRKYSLYVYCIGDVASKCPILEPPYHFIGSNAVKRDDCRRLLFVVTPLLTISTNLFRSDKGFYMLIDTASKGLVGMPYALSRGE